MLRRREWFCALLLVSAAAACGGGGSGAPGSGVPSAPPTHDATPTASPTPTPTATASPFVCATAPPGFSLSPTCLVFTSPNAPPQSFTVSESGYGGNFSIDAASTCLNAAPGRGAATISPLSGATTFAVTPEAASPQPGGTCEFTILDSNGKSVQYDVAITSTVVTGR